VLTGVGNGSRPMISQKNLIESLEGLLVLFGLVNVIVVALLAVHFTLVTLIAVLVALSCI